MDDLIKALQLLRKYGTNDHAPTHCEHDVLSISAYRKKPSSSSGRANDTPPNPEDEMKKEELKVGLWVGSEIPSRVIWFDDRWAVVTNLYSDMPVVLDRKTTVVEPSTPALLTAAGVDDSLRLVEQRDVWSGVTLWQYAVDLGKDQFRNFFKIDGAFVGYVFKSSNNISLGGPTSDEPLADVTTDPRYAWVFAREDILQAVAEFRRKRDEGVLRWNLGDGWIYRVKNGRAEGWLNESKVWKPIAGPPDSSIRVITNCSIATPLQLASSGVPISDVPESMRGEVERIRGAKATLPDGSVMVVGEMYVASNSNLFVIAADRGGKFAVNIHNGDGSFRGSQCYYTSAGIADIDAPENMKLRITRLAQPSDIPAGVDINLVPARIRDEVRKLRTPPPSSAKETRTAFDFGSWPLGAWVRAEDRDSFYAVVESSTTGITLVMGVVEHEDGDQSCGYMTVTWDELIEENWRYSLDGKSWHPCIRQSLAEGGAAREGK